MTPNTPGATAYGHAHAEAFMLMQYECSPPRSTPFGQSAAGCGAVEIVWNSRDGVTPFVIDCRACGGQATHARWNEDRYAPDHKPAERDRIFVDLTPERAKVSALANARVFWDHPQYPASKDGRWHSIEEMADALAQQYLDTPGNPTIVVVGEDPEWPVPTPAPRGYFCVVHNQEHRADWPWEYEECVSERDHAIATAGHGTSVEDWADATYPLGRWARLRARIACWRRGNHEWLDFGATLGGVWLRCKDCQVGEEFLPGVHEPKGGEEIWQARLRRAGVR